LRGKSRSQTDEELTATAVSQNYLRQMPRRWKVGDVYAPRDLSAYEMRKWRNASPMKKDQLDMLGMNPLDNYRVRLSFSPRFSLRLPVG
jgi:small subunit ribosomal protein S18